MNAKKRISRKSALPAYEDLPELWTCSSRTTVADAHLFLFSINQVCHVQGWCNLFLSRKKRKKKDDAVRISFFSEEDMCPLLFPEDLQFSASKISLHSLLQQKAAHKQESWRCLGRGPLSLMDYNWRQLNLQSPPQCTLICIKGGLHTGNLYLLLRKQILPVLILVIFHWSAIWKSPISSCS